VVVADGVRRPESSGAVAWESPDPLESLYVIVNQGFFAVEQGRDAQLMGL